MAFPSEQTRSPQVIGNLVVTLKDAIAVGEQPAYQSAHFSVQVIFDNGSIVERRGDLAPHITAQQRNTLIQFLSDLRAQAEQQILGTP